MQRARERVDQVGGGVPGVDVGTVGRADNAGPLVDSHLQVHLARTDADPDPAVEMTPHGWEAVSDDGPVDALVDTTVDAAPALHDADAVLQGPPVLRDVDERFIEAVLLGLVPADVKRDNGWAWLAREVRLDDAVVSWAARTLGMRRDSDRDVLVGLGLVAERAFGVDGVTVQHLSLVKQLVDVAAGQELSRDWGGLRGLVARVRGGGLGSDLEVRILLELLAGANRAKDRAGLAELEVAWAQWEHWLLPAITSDKLFPLRDRVWALGLDAALEGLWPVVEPDVGVALAYLG